MNDVAEIMKSMVTVQAAGVRAGLQAGDLERERLERERDAALDLLCRIMKQIDPENTPVGLGNYLDAHALLRKHGRLPL